MMRDDNNEGKVQFEDALNKTGFGVYSYLYVGLTGCVVISFATVAFCTTIIVPTSACELGTTAGQQGFIAAAPIVAVLIGAPPWGYFGDTRGRRKMLLLSLLCSSIIAILASLSINWIMLVIILFIATLVAAGQFSLSMTLLSESIPMAKRNLMLLLVTSIFLLTQGIMAVIAMPVIPLTYSYYMPTLGIYWNSWRTLMVIYTIPSMLTAIWLYFMTESPKFLLAKGDEEGALEILRTIHRRNKMKDEFQVKCLLQEEQKKIPGKSSVKDQIMPLFKAPLLKNTIIMTLLFLFQQIGALQIWFPRIANEFMQMIEDGTPMDQTLCSVIRSNVDVPPDPNEIPCSLNNTAMFIVLATCVLQSFVNVVVSLGVNKFGRRNSVIFVTAVCGLSGVTINLVPNTIASASFFVIFLMGVIVLGFYTAITVAIFPTHLRVLALALVMSSGRIGQTISVQVLNLLLNTNCDAGFYIFASLFASSALVASFLPDDRKKIQQTQLPSKDDQERTVL